MKLRKMTHKDVRAMIVAGQGWDPGDLGPGAFERIKPLSEEAKNSPFIRMLPIDKKFAARMRRIAARKERSK